MSRGVNGILRWGFRRLEFSFVFLLGIKSSFFMHSLLYAWQHAFHCGVDSVSDYALTVPRLAQKIDIYAHTLYVIYN